MPAVVEYKSEVYTLAARWRRGESIHIAPHFIRQNLGDINHQAGFHTVQMRKQGWNEAAPCPSGNHRQSLSLATHWQT